ncbi:MAG: DUF6799 domain-containing protein [Ginsengibacter sp.]
MKKLVAFIITVTILASCNSGTSNDQSFKDSSASLVNSTDTMSTTLSPSAEGTAGMRSGKMMVVKSGSWKIMSQPSTCSDGCRVTPTGLVIMKNGDKMMLKEGETIDTHGNMMDASGKMMVHEKMQMSDSMK